MRTSSGHPRTVGRVAGLAIAPLLAIVVLQACSSDAAKTAPNTTTTSATTSSVAASTTSASVAATVDTSSESSSPSGTGPNATATPSSAAAADTTVATTDATSSAESASSTASSVEASETTVARLLPSIAPGVQVIQGGDSTGRFFPFQYSMTTTGPWHLQAERDNVLILDRNDGQYFFMVSIGVIEGATPADAIANACPSGSADLASSVDSPLLGATGLRGEGTLTTGCSYSVDNFGHFSLEAGDGFRVDSAEVEGQLVTVIADYPTTDAAFPGELDGMIASMTLTG